MPVLEPADQEFATVEYTGLAVQDTGHGYHTGVLYRLGEDPPRIVHLAFHYAVMDDEAAAPFRWSRLGLDADNRIVLSYLASRIAGAGDLVSYGFDSHGAIFDAATGELSEMPVGKGLTCATFIVAFLRTYGHELINIDDWPDRPEDVDWQAQMLELLEQHATAEHVEAVRLDIGAKRIRPTEVVGAGAVDSQLWPLSFIEARALADQVEADLAA